MGCVAIAQPIAQQVSGTQDVYTAFVNLDRKRALLVALDFTNISTTKDAYISVIHDIGGAGTNLIFLFDKELCPKKKVLLNGKKLRGHLQWRGTLVLKAFDKIKITSVDKNGAAFSAYVEGNVTETI